MQILETIIRYKISRKKITFNSPSTTKVVAKRDYGPRPQVSRKKPRVDLK